MRAGPSASVPPSPTRSTLDGDADSNDTAHRMQPLQVVAAVPAAAHEETIPEALVTGRPPVGLGELQPGAAATAPPDAVDLGYTQMERRKQLAIQWYCVSCKEGCMSRTLTSCRRCGVTMVCSAPAQTHHMENARALRLEPCVKRQKSKDSKSAGKMGSEEEEEAKTRPRSRPAAKRAPGSTHDCVCIVLQGTLSLARVRLSR